MGFLTRSQSTSADQGHDSAVLPCTADRLTIDEPSQSYPSSKSPVGVRVGPWIRKQQDLL